MNQNKIDAESAKSKEETRIEEKSLLKVDDCNIQYGSASDDVMFLRLDSQNQSKFSKICEVLTTLTIEPIIFCFMFGFVMNMAVLTSFMMDIGCRKHLNYSSKICNNLSEYPDAKEEVEILATDFSLYNNLISLIGAFFMIFIAPWSDKYGRRIPLLCAVVSTIFTDAGLILCTVFDTRLEYLLLSKLSSEFFGGFICVLTIVYSHASEVSTEKNRTLKYTTIEIAMGLGMSLGVLAGGFMYRYYGYFYVYVTVACLHSFCVLWIAIAVEETTGLDINLKFIEKAKDLFVCSSFKEGVKATFKARGGTTRILISLLLVSMCFIVLTYESFGSIGFVYVHHIYDWDASTYSMVVTSVMLFQMVFTLVSVPILIKVAKVRDFTLGIIGAASMMAKQFVLAFAKPHPYIYYLGQIAGFCGQLCSLAIRTGLSKIVHRDELGKVFSFLATCEAIFPMVGNIAVTKIFEATMDIFPNVAYASTAALLIVPFLTFIFATISTRRPYVAMVTPEVTTPHTVKA